MSASVGRALLFVFLILAVIFVRSETEFINGKAGSDAGGAGNADEGWGEVKPAA